MAFARIMTSQFITNISVSNIIMQWEAISKQLRAMMINDILVFPSFNIILFNTVITSIVKCGIKSPIH